MSKYSKNELEMNFFEMMVTTRKNTGAILLGYVDVAGEVHLNPKDKLEKRKWDLKDQFIMLTEFVH